MGNFGKKIKTNKKNTKNRHALPSVCRSFANAAFLWPETREMENIMNNSKKSMTAFCTAWTVARPVVTFAASGVIELEIPGMNPVRAFTSRPQV